MLGGFSREGLGIYHPHRLLYWVEGFELIVGIELIEGFELFNEVGPLVAPRDVHAILEEEVLQILRGDA